LESRILLKYEQDSIEISTMPTGSVKWFNNAKGYGFILPEDESEDYFVHYSSIVMDGYKTLKAGQAVSFDMIDGPKGIHAVNVSPVESESDSEPDA
jgi:cold shock protein